MYIVPFIASHRDLMVLIPTNAEDIVPRGGLVAQKTLAYVGMRLAGHAGRDHLEMHHVMARRGLMALGTVG